jgi:hypothetical protein
LAVRFKYQPGGLGSPLLGHADQGVAVREELQRDGARLAGPASPSRQEQRPPAPQPDRAALGYAEQKRREPDGARVDFVLYAGPDALLEG